MQFLIRERMRGMPEPTSIKSRGALLLELARELRELKEELEERRYGKLQTNIPSPATIVTYKMQFILPQKKSPNQPNERYHKFQRQSIHRNISNAPR